MHYLIFLPNAKGNPRDNVFSVGGLESLLRPGDRGPAAIDLEGVGPSGELGQIVTWHEPGQPLAYLPDRQYWWKCLPDPDRDLDGGRFWYGVWSEERPTPADLARGSADGPLPTDGPPRAVGTRADRRLA